MKNAIDAAAITAVWRLVVAAVQVADALRDGLLIDIAGYAKSTAPFEEAPADLSSRSGSHRRIEFTHPLAKAHQFSGARENACFNFGAVDWIDIRGCEHVV